MIKDSSIQKDLLGYAFNQRIYYLLIISILRSKR